MTEKAVNVQVGGFGGPCDVRVRALDPGELNELILHARDVGWIGESALLTKLVSVGCLDCKDVDVQELDVSMVADIAREIWFHTLRQLARETSRLSAYGNDCTVRPKRYRFSDLASPLLLFFLEDRIDLMDTTRFADQLLDFRIVGAKVGGREVSKSELPDMVASRRDAFLTEYFRFTRLEHDLMARLRVPFCNSIDDRFYLAHLLTDTLDWSQYGRILTAFNRRLEDMAFVSNQLGGVDSPKEGSTRLITAIPMFVSLLTARTTLPIEVCIRVAEDASRNKLDYISHHYRTLIRRMLKQALTDDSVRELVRERAARERIVLAVLNHFATLIYGNPRLCDILCFQYWSEWREATRRRLTEMSEDTQRELRELMKPHCYILVEGPSDEVCYSRIVSMRESKGERVRVLACGSHNGVVAHIRTMLRDEYFAGGIVTVLDADAKRQHDELQRLTRQRSNTAHFIYHRGALEDQFPSDAHAKVVSRITNGAVPIEHTRLADCANVVHTVKKLLWQQARITLDKVEYGRALSEALDEASIPLICREIVDTAIGYAVRSVRHRGTESAASVDGRMKELARVLV